MKNLLSIILAILMIAATVPMAFAEGIIPDVGGIGNIPGGLEGEDLPDDITDGVPDSGLTGGLSDSVVSAIVQAVAKLVAEATEKKESGEEFTAEEIEKYKENIEMLEELEKNYEEESDSEEKDRALEIIRENKETLQLIVNSYQSSQHKCDFSGDWERNENKHWKKCTCELTANEENHTWVNGVCDVCTYICSHEWGEGTLTRPTKTEEGYYTYTCSVCADTKTEPVERADYGALNLAVSQLKAYLNYNITESVKSEINKLIEELESDDTYGFVKGEENQLAPLVEEIEELVKATEEGIADGTAVKINGLEEIVKINDALNNELAEKYGEEALAEIAEKLDEKFADKFNELYEKAEALTGTVAENAETLEEIKAEFEALFAEIEKCLAGTHSFANYTETTPAKCGENAKETGTCAVCGETDEREVEGTALEHIFLDYASNGDATCTADGTKTAECVNGCGATDTVTDEGSMIDHADEDGDSLCDGCGKELICKDCGRPVHEETGIPQYVCLIIALIRLIISFLNAVK